MGIIFSDLLIKSALEYGISDMKKNLWIVEDCFSSLAEDPLLRGISGYKEVKKATDWFKDVNIEVIQQFRVDAPTFPCIAIAHTGTSEKIDRTSLGDEGLIEDLEPSKAKRKIIKVVDNFTPLSYNPDSGLLIMANSNEDVAIGQFLVSKDNKAFEIKKIVGANGFVIMEGAKFDASSCYIAPKYSVWNLHKDITYLREDFQISVHTSSDIVTCIWLHQLVLYILLRYKESLLEARGFEVSTFNSSELQRNAHFTTENVFSRYINFSGDVQMDVVKYAAKKFEKTSAKILIVDGPRTPEALMPIKDNEAWQMKKDKE